MQLGFVLSIVGSLLVGFAPRRRARGLLPIARPCAAGLVGRLHHAGEPGPGEGLLGRGRPAARRQPVVDRLLGRFRLLRLVRRPRGAEFRVALDFLRLCRRRAARHGADEGHPGEQGRRAPSTKFDLAGIATFMVAMVALQIVVTQGNSLGWRSPVVLSLTAIALVVGGLFFGIEARAPNAFVDFKLFGNRTYAGATISNFLLNGAAGALLVSLQLVQLGGDMTAQQAGHADAGLRDCDRCVHSGWREAPAEVRCPRSR